MGIKSTSGQFGVRSWIASAEYIDFLMLLQNNHVLPKKPSLWYYLDYTRLEIFLIIY